MGHLNTRQVVHKNIMDNKELKRILIEYETMSDVSDGEMEDIEVICQRYEVLWIRPTIFYPVDAKSIVKFSNNCGLVSTDTALAVLLSTESTRALRRRWKDGHDNVLIPILALKP